MSFKQTVLGLIGERVFDPARISSIEVLSEHFRLIQIESPSFLKKQWRPGEKIQINVGEWNVRTYTPIAIDTFTGRMQILAFIHGNGPGSAWAKGLKAGDLCQVMGPRPSLRISEEERPRILFGDETSFAVALTLKKYFGISEDLRFIFEVSSVEECKFVCERLGLATAARFIEKKHDGTHAAEILSILEASRAAHHLLVLTGSAKSIQKVRNHFREVATTGMEILTKPYWSLGKAGLD